MVKQVFSQYGVVESVRVIPAKFPNSPTHALVKFASVQEAQWLCENLNNNIPEGMTDPVQVKYATKGGGRGNNSNAGGGMANGGGVIMATGGPWTGGIAAPYRAGPYGGKGDGWGGGKGAGKGGDSVEALYQALGHTGCFPIPAYPHGTYVANLPADTQDLDL